MYPLFKCEHYSILKDDISNHNFEINCECSAAIIRFQGAVFSQPNTIHCTYVYQCRDSVAKLLHESLQLYSDIICA